MPTVLVLGATGLVGGECLKMLIQEPTITRVVVIARRPLSDTLGSAKLARYVTDLERLDTVADRFAVDAIICALGTTIKAAGSKERFRAVDYGIPFAAAKLGVERGARHFVLVSSLGADAHSLIFYNRVKGELEEALRGLGYQSLTLLRPSILLGARETFRLGEALAKLVAPLIPGRLRGIQARDVARCAVLAVQESPAGVRVVESDAMREWARGTNLEERA
jgi:uncharacterized protein YbjT (DUF2867 family)